MLMCAEYNTRKHGTTVDAIHTSLRREILLLQDIDSTKLTTLSEPFVLLHQVFIPHGGPSLSAFSKNGS
jgi:hypothetical protein